MRSDYNIEQILTEVKEKYPDLYAVSIQVEDIIFEERVKLNCFYCGKYNQNWKCPPKSPEIDYKKVFSEYDHAALVYVKIPFTEETYSEVRQESSVTLHRGLLEMEKVLWDQGNSLSLSFIGGSCKLCKNGCGKEKCNNPYLARIPLESVGVNVIKLAACYGISVIFPPKTHLLRIGMLLW